ncbi:MAG: PDZ domain-containing protein [Phycisphaerales bacterium]|jgi:hypothetical protein|nr:PDZ domain-containing protein [Phycisphaerales bacterium]
MDRITTRIAAISVAAVAGLAIAQQGSVRASSSPVVSEINSLRGAVARQPERNVAGRQTQSESTATIVINDDEHNYQITVRNGEVSAKIDGKPVPDDRIERRGRAVVLTHEDGTESTFDVGFAVGGNNVRGFRFQDAPPQGTASFWSPQITLVPSLENGQLNLRAQLQPEEPRVIIGITLGEVEDVLAQHLGIDASESILVLDAPADLPAAKAGIQANDIIIELDGSPNASPEHLREVLASKNPGDPVEVRVVRRGEKKEFQVRVQEYKRPNELAVAPEVNVVQSDVEEEIRRAMEEALAGMRAGHGSATGEAQAAIEQAMSEVKRALAEARDERREAARAYRVVPTPRSLWTPDAPGVFVAPSAPDAPAAPSADMVRAQVEFAKIRESLAQEREQLARDREAMARERESLQNEIRELRKAVEALARQRAQGDN